MSPAIAGRVVRGFVVVFFLSSLAAVAVSRHIYPVPGTDGSSPVAFVSLTDEALSALVLFGILGLAIAAAAYAVRMVRRS